MTREKFIGPMHTCNDATCVLPSEHEGQCSLLAPVVISYTNWKGDKRERRVVPTGVMMHAANPPWHPSEQWLFAAIDCEDGKHKWFAMDGLHAWKE